MLTCVLPCISRQQCRSCTGERPQGLHGSAAAGRGTGRGVQQSVQEDGQHNKQQQQPQKQAPMDSKVLLSVAAALQGNGLAQVMRQLASKAQAEDEVQK